MLEREMNALKQQYCRIRVFLTLAYDGPCALNAFTREWHESGSWDAKALVVERWVRAIADMTIVRTDGDDAA